MIKYFNTFENWGYFPNPIQVIFNIEDSFNLKTWDRTDFYSDDFRSEIHIGKNADSPEEVVSLFQDLLSKSLTYYLPFPCIPNFLFRLMDDLTIELKDICLSRINQKDVEAQTAKSKFYYNRSYQTLRKKIMSSFSDIHKRDEWNFFLANYVTPIGAECCYFSMHGAPAIITSLEMNESLIPFHSEAPFHYSDFQQQYALLISLIENKESTWKDAYRNEENYHPEKLAFYHMEKLWKLHYISKMITYFDNMNIGLTIYPANSKSSIPIYKPLDKGKLQDSDINPFWNILKELETKSSNLQTNLFLMNDLLSSKINPDIYDMSNLSFLISHIIPSIKNLLYYFILKSCITEPISGKDLYHQIYDFCLLYSNKALVKYYTLPSIEKPVEAPDKSSVNFKQYCFSQIASYVYNNQTLQSSTFAPKDYKKKITELHQLNDKLNYSPCIFQDRNNIKKLNPL